MLHDRLSFLRPGFLVGMLVSAGAAVGLGVSPRFGLDAGAATLAVLCIVIIWTKRALPFHIAIIATCLFSSGFLAGQHAPRGEIDDALSSVCDGGASVRFIGRVAEPLTRRRTPPRWLSNAEQLRLAIVIDVDAIRIGDEWKPTRGRVWLGAEEFPLSAKVGDEVEGSAWFSRIRGPSNPGEADARSRFAQAGIAAVGSLEKGSLAVLRFSNGWSRHAEDFRARFTHFVQAELGENDRSALVAALAVGERSSLSVDLNQSFNASGLAHVLSISGLHLTVAILSFVWFLRRLFALSAALSARISPRQLAAAVALPMIVVYVVVIGAPAPAVRAGIGTGLVLLAVALGRDADVFNTLGWALAAIVLIDPAAVLHPSTQLSFIGVTGLAYFTPRFREWIPLTAPDADVDGWRRMIRKFREGVLQLVLGSASATLASVPITALYFERTSLVASAANVVAWPASTLIVPSGALAALLHPISPLAAKPFVHVAGWCASSLLWCARAFAQWPLAQVHVPAPSTGAMISYAVVVLCLANLRRWPRIITAPAIGFAVLAFVAFSWRPLSVPHRLEVTFLAVGQGDATVVRFPQGATMVVDAGGVISQRYDPGERVVAPFLTTQGVRKIDVLVASHPHPDHIGGLPSLVNRFDIGELWHNGDALPLSPQHNLITLAEQRGAVARTFTQGLPAHCPSLTPLREAMPSVAALSVGDPRCAPPAPHRQVEGVDIEILHPLSGPERASFPELGENDNSLVLRLTYGDVHVLLPGDIEHEAESMLLARGVDLSADLVKAPHHGSRTSSTEAFVQAVKPRYVVFCTGLNNQFGFPTREVDDRYAAAKCARYRTDLDGAVSFATDGRSWTVERFQNQPSR